MGSRRIVEKQKWQKSQRGKKLKKVENQMIFYKVCKTVEIAGLPKWIIFNNCKRPFGLKMIFKVL